MITIYNNHWEDTEEPKGMALLKEMYDVVQSSKIIMQAKFEIEVKPTVMDSGYVSIYDPAKHGIQTVYAILFKSESGNYAVIAPDFLKLDDGFIPCGKFGDIKLMFTILNDDEDDSINQFKELVGM